MDKYRAYFTYRLYLNDSGYLPAPTTSIQSKPVHCNYINMKEFDSLTNKFLYLKFPDEDEFKFMSLSGNTGFVADTMQILVQIVPPNEELKSYKWKIFDVTQQILDQTSQTAGLIDKANLVATVFEIKLSDYLTNPEYFPYKLNYEPEEDDPDIGIDLNYPNELNPDDLSFGDEEYLIGNVEADIGATAYTTDLQLTLPTQTFNYSTNKTWTEGNDVYVSEIGLYDSEDNLVGIGKLNRPILKNNETSRTFVFEIDF
ncbi:MAG: hypothetical protein ACOCVF_00250 [bacterium]